MRWRRAGWARPTDVDGQLPSTADLAGIPSMSGLNAEEAQFVFNCEVLGLPVRKAASMAGLPVTMVSKPHLQQARELLKREIRGVVNITKEDVVFGMREAIDRARILAEPATEIIGWKEIAKLLGYDSPQKIDVNITASIEVMKSYVRTMDDTALAELLGARGVIDGDFYRLGSGSGEA